jgi:hypothetical protein
MWVCWCTCLCAGKTTLIIYGLFEAWLVAHLEGKGYRAVFVTASPILKEQVQGAFSRYQVCVLHSTGNAVLASRLAEAFTAANCCTFKWC